MNIVENSADLIGNTPLLKISAFKTEATILAKLEAFNPASSVKDRVAKHMIEQAEADGRLKPGSTIIEPTSGNTGIALAALGAAKGYEVILTMPETMSVERRSLINAYGAKIVLTKASDGMKGAIQKALELSRSIKGSFIPNQFTNPANPKAHELTTGPEIWKSTCGAIDIFVAGVGTGGTITGVGRYLKSKKKQTKIVAVEPAESPILSRGIGGSHKIQGIGAGFIPEVLDTDIYDEVIAVEEKTAFAFLRIIAKRQGILVGISSGAALFAAVKLACRPENKDSLIVALLPDTGERYLSTGLFAE